VGYQPGLTTLRYFHEYRTIGVNVAPDAATQDLARIFRALGDPSRLAIFELVRECCREDSGHSAADLRNSVSEIAKEFDLSLSTVSHHLKELRTAGLIKCERQGQHIFCSVDPGCLSVVEKFMRTGQS
jgi:ArsR family transcriptional regulator, arsenate/arsenite/antimonite-responsive transcriptional repressor